jgi:hypothetical protein
MIWGWNCMNIAIAVYLSLILVMSFATFLHTGGIKDKPPTEVVESPSAPCTRRRSLVDGPVRFSPTPRKHRCASCCTARPSPCLSVPGLFWRISRHPDLGIVGIWMIVLAPAFHHLAVVDQGEFLAIRFGPLPLFRRKVRYDKILKVEVGRTLILEGWGIHLSIRGG